MRKEEENPMSTDKAFDSATYVDQVRLAERELTSFILAVDECFGPEQARLSADDWLDECELMDSPPRCCDRNWRAVTIAASARLANRLTSTPDHQATASKTGPKTHPILSSNCLVSPLLV